RAFPGKCSVRSRTLLIESWRKTKSANKKQAFGRCWTLRLNILVCTGLTVNASTLTMSRSITSVLASKNGNSLLVAATTFILMTAGGGTVFLVTLSLVALLMSLSCDYADAMALIAGSWLALTHCATNRDRLCFGMLPRRTSRIESRLKTGFGAKTSLYAKKSIRPRCLKRLLEPLQLCKLCCRAF